MTSPHSKPYRQFRKRLKLARIEAEMTQDDAAKSLKKPRSYVSKCELGERRVDFVEVLAFAELYGQPLSYFVPAGSNVRVVG